MFTLLFFTGLLFGSIDAAAQKPKMPVMDNCDRVQTLLTRLPDFKGALINDNAYECRKEYILDGFTEARVLVPGKEGKYWTVNMNTDEMQQVEAESTYLLLIKELMKCTYLNSWKGSETIVGDGIYHFNFKQSISASGYYKNILISYYQLKNNKMYRVEVTMTN